MKLTVYLLGKEFLLKKTRRAIAYLEYCQFWLARINLQQCPAVEHDASLLKCAKNVGTFLFTLPTNCPSSLKELASNNLHGCSGRFVRRVTRFPSEARLLVLY